MSETRARTAALAWLAEQDAPEAAIAVHEAGVAESDADARRWVRRILDGEREGSWGRDLLATAEALLTLHELREAARLKEQDPAIGRALDWVRGRTGRPGAWTEGCTPERHRRGLCHHFAGGFFSPGTLAIPEIELASGAVVTGDNQARFVVSAEALRCVLVWRGLGTDAGLHLEVLRRIVDAWRDAPDGFTMTALLAAARSLIASPAPEDRDAASRALAIAAGKQRGDGSWMDADPFHAMAVFAEAAGAGVGGDRARSALEYGVRLLVATQHDDGSWGPEHGPRRALIALRCLRRRSAATP
ncbi:MAG: hypothetical protein R3314_03475 [Longimicrobiales bacterium]|nr:hypothetical protein [Longimicrobiales bacterium]